VLRGIVVVVYKVVFLLLHSYNSLNTLLVYFFLVSVLFCSPNQYIALQYLHWYSSSPKYDLLGYVSFKC
jgi:hypothetical protein